MQTITSKDNELIKHIRKLKDKKYRDESNEYVVEGVKLVEEAVKENAKIPESVTEMHLRDFHLIVKAGSYAEQYAKEYAESNNLTYTVE